MVAPAVTITLAFVGYIAAYLSGLRLARRSERLARVNRRLGDFYGPLFAITEANSRAFEAFAQRNARPDGRSPFDHEDPPTEEELAEWRLRVTTVFLPNIRTMHDLVVTHADLLRESEMPPILLKLCAHVSGYEITAARWAQGGSISTCPSCRSRARTSPTTRGRGSPRGRRRRAGCRDGGGLPLEARPSMLCTRSHHNSASLPACP